MFDYIKCEMPLPSVPEQLIKTWGSVDAIRFQTKDTDSQGMNLYIINNKGELYHKKQEFEWVSDSESDSLLNGYAEVVSETLEECFFTGDIEFYDSYKHPEYESSFGAPSRFQYGWVEYRALFIKGKLHGDIELVKDEPPIKFTDEEMSESQLRWEESRKEMKKISVSRRRDLPSPSEKLIDSIYKLASDNSEITSLIDEYRKLHDTHYEETN